MRALRTKPVRLVAAALVGSLAFSSVAYAASLGLGSRKLHVWSQTLTKGTCDQTSATADDTYVQQASPTSTAGGTANTLTISGASNAQDYAFVRFDLSACNLPTTGGADSAVLTLYVTSTSSDTISFYPVYSSWSSSTLNWSGVSGLTIAPTATATFVPSSMGAQTITVTASADLAIKAGTLWGWELRDTSGTSTAAVGASDNSSSGKRPSMTLSYEK